MNFGTESYREVSYAYSSNECGEHYAGHEFEDRVLSHLEQFDYLSQTLGH